MARRYTSLGASNQVIDRDVNSKYEKVAAVGDNLEDIETVADNIADVTAVAENISDITDVVDAANNIKDLNVVVTTVDTDTAPSATLEDAVLTLDLPKGERGIPGTDGEDGLGAYEEWLLRDNSGTVQDYLDSLVGRTGDKGTSIDHIEWHHAESPLGEPLHDVPQHMIGTVDIYYAYADKFNNEPLGSIKVRNSDTDIQITDEDLKLRYERNADTNAFDDASKSKLDSLLTVAELAVLTASNRDRANHTGTQSIDTITETDELKVMTQAEREIIALVPGKQDALVSQVNIKSINGDSILGEGNLVVAAGSGGYAANVFFGSAPSTTVPSYDSLSYSPEEAETVLTATVNDNEVLMKKFLFDGDVLAEDIPAGEWGFHIYRSASSSAGDTSIRFEVFTRQVDGTEVVLFTRSSRNIEDTSVERGSILTTQRTFDIAPTDRLGVSMYAVTTNTEDTTVSVSIGDGEASYIVSPLQLRHNQLRSRDAENCHPVEAIDGLRGELTSISDSVTQLGSTTAQNLAEVDNRLTQSIANTSATLTSSISTLSTTTSDNLSEVDGRLSTRISSLDSEIETALELKTNKSEFDSHIGDSSNPHNVTSEQVGLGNVDNTADTDKPVSGAQAAAIEGAIATKADAGVSYTKAEADTLLDDKANVVDVYTTAAADLLLDAKSNVATTYTKAEVDDITGAGGFNPTAVSAQISGSTSVSNTIHSAGLLTRIYTGVLGEQDIDTGVGIIDFTEPNNGSGYWLDRIGLIFQDLFSTGIDGWSPIAGNITWDAASNGALKLQAVTNASARVSRVITGLVIGKTYTVTVISQGSGDRSSWHRVDCGESGGSATGSTGPIAPSGSYGPSVFSFVASGVVHNMSISTDNVAGTTAFIDSIKVVEGTVVKNDAGVVQDLSTPINLALPIDKYLTRITIKARTAAYQHVTVDSFRGRGFYLRDNVNGAEIGDTPISSFNSNGLTLGTSAAVNQPGIAYVLHQEVYTTVRMGLTSAGELSLCAYNPITKCGMNYRTGSGIETSSWRPFKVSYQEIKRISADEDGFAYFGDQDYLRVYASVGGNAASSHSSLWSSDAAADDSFTVNNNSGVNFGGADYIEYFFSNSDFKVLTRYTGTGLTNNFATTGFRVSRLTFKGLSVASNWTVLDNKRDTAQSMNHVVYRNTGQIEADLGGTSVRRDIDKVVFNNGNSLWNQSLATYLVIAERDTSTDGGDTYYNKPSTSSQLNINSGGFMYTNGKDERGYKLSSDSFFGAVPVAANTTGLKWIAKYGGSDTIELFDKKPSIGLYENEDSDDSRVVFLDGRQYKATTSELITNGKDFVDTSGWTVGNGTLTLEDGKLKLFGAFELASQQLNLLNGVEYVFKMKGHNANLVIRDSDGGNLGETPLGGGTLYITGTGGGVNVNLRVPGTNASPGYVDYVTGYKRLSSVGLPLNTPLSFVKNPVRYDSGVPQYIDYTDTFVGTYTDDLNVGKLEVDDIKFTDRPIFKGYAGGTHITAPNVLFDWTVDEDTHNAYDGGIWTCKKDGWYRVNLRVWNYHNTSTSTIISSEMYVNNALEARLYSEGTSAQMYIGIEPTVLKQLKIGDTVYTKSITASSTHGIYFKSDKAYTNIVIEWVGE